MVSNLRLGPPRARRWAALATLAVAIVVVGCGRAPAASPPSSSRRSSTVPAGSQPATAAFAWLRDKAEPWNHRLNTDQRAIIAAGGAVKGVSDTAYFSRLQSACSTMLAHAEQAHRIAHAPAAGLDQAWEAMLTETETYASDCRVLARTHAQQDLTTWNNSLVAMNQASGAWNTAVSATRNGENAPSG
jgi:hypothetical protein